MIQLPYAEIREPFESWIDVNAGFSRIDYYGGKKTLRSTEFSHPGRSLGAAKTVQRKGKGDQDFGANYKVVPMSSETIENESGRIGEMICRRTSVEYDQLLSSQRNQGRSGRCSTHPSRFNFVRSQFFSLLFEVRSTFLGHGPGGMARHQMSNVPNDRSRGGQEIHLHILRER